MPDLGYCEHTLEDLDKAPCRTPLSANQQQAVQECWVKDPGNDGRTLSRVVPGQVSGAIGQILVESGLTTHAGVPVDNTLGKGTGVIINWKDYEALLTCAHNIVNWCTISKKMVPIKSGIFYKARLNTSYHCALRLTGCPIWHKSYSPSTITDGFDIALVNFERSEKYKRTRKDVDCKIMDITALSVKEPTLTVIGYPGDMHRTPGYQMKMSNKLEWASIAEGGVTIKYKIDTSIGQSGSPVFAEVDGKLYLVGVHNGHLSHLNVNFATGMSAAIMTWIDETINKLKTQAGHVHVPRPMAAICDRVTSGDVATSGDDALDTLTASPPGGADCADATTGLRHLKITPPEPMDTGDFVTKSTTMPLSTTPGENGAAGHVISHGPQVVRGAGDLKSEAVVVMEAQPCSPPARAPIAWGPQQPSQGISMSDAHRESLQCNIGMLAQNLHADEALLDLLVASKCFTESMREEVEIERTNSAKVRAVAKILPRRGPEAMKKFVDALMLTQQPHVAYALAPELHDAWLRATAARDYPSWEP